MTGEPITYADAGVDIHAGDKAVELMKGTVETAVREVGEAVRDTAVGMLDVPGHVRRNPWLLVGGAALAGLVIGTLYAARCRS